eukprot:gene10742-22439_t
MFSLSETEREKIDITTYKSNLSDLATLKYFQLVYKEGLKFNFSSINISNIHIGYLIQEVEVVAPPRNMHWNHIIVKKTISNTHFYDSYQWAEVTRFASSCLLYNHTSEEGFSSGWSGIGPKVPYGCWFLRYPGTGIYVNVGRTITAKTRYELMLKLDLKPDKDTCTPDNLKCPDDKEFCGAALKLGYDSIQANHYGSFRGYTMPELVMCNGQCATVPFNTTCPPGIVLKTGMNGHKSCTCNDKFKILNCGKKRKEMKKCRVQLNEYAGKRRKSCFLLSNTITDSPTIIKISVILYLE